MIGVVSGVSVVMHHASDVSLFRVRLVWVVNVCRFGVVQGSSGLLGEPMVDIERLGGVVVK